MKSYIFHGNFFVEALCVYIDFAAPKIVIPATLCIKKQHYEYVHYSINAILCRIGVPITTSNHVDRFEA